MMTERVLALVSDIMTAVTNCSLYAKSHPSVARLASRAADIIAGLAREEELSITVLGGRILVNDTPLKRESMHLSAFATRLRRKRLEKVVFRHGVPASEIAEFIAALADPDAAPVSRGHISVGALEVRLRAEDSDVATEIQEDIGQVREIYQGISKFRKLDMVGLEEVVVSFISALRRESNILRLVSPVKAHSDYTFAHTTNVTILSIFQAESLGMRGEVLHEVGLAGLLHDVGKTFVPNEVLEKPGKLTDEEWAIMKQHPLQGAKYLSSLPDVPRLAVIATYEHHMKFDGSGYPDPLRRGKQQHVVSQIVALSDFFDALRTERPYRKALEVPVIVGIMREASGKDFNPLMVEHFIGALKTCGAA
jgi:HD-GYP domain-containing protein (c-di-GMP phosphodiesterase class II)